MTPTAPAIERWTARASVLAVVGAILTAGVRAAVDGWYPIGDNALLTLRARDVLTAHHPWLGTWTSASLSVGTPINNPGPLHFDLLAPFAKAHHAAGVAIGVAVLNAAAVLLVAAFAGRIGGPRLVALSMVAAGGLAWSMGSELLFDPWQPHSLVLPFLALVVLAVAVGAGDLAALPWAVGVGSVIVQAHLSYAVLVPGLLFVAMAWAALQLRRRDGPPAERLALRRRWGRWVGIAAVVVVLCWAQPLWEQVGRDGNLATVATNAGAGDTAVGVEAGLRIAGSVLGDPTGWVRPSFGERFLPDPLGADIAPPGAPLAEVRSLPTALASLLGVAALVAASAWLALRRRDRTGVAGAVVAGAALALALATTIALPVSEVLGIAPHQLRYLWPIAAVATLLPLAALLPRHPAVTLGAGAVAVVLAVATVPSSNVAAGPSADVAAQAVVDDVADQIDGWAEQAGDRVLYFDGRTVPFAEPFSGPVLLELDRHEVAFEVDDEFSHQVGPRRRGPDDATHQLRIVVGPDALHTPPGSERIAVADALDPAERERFDALSARLPALLADADVRLSERGEAARRQGRLPQLVQPGWADDVGLLVDGGLLRALVQERWADIDALPAEIVEWAGLAQREARYSVAVLVELLAR